MRRLRSAICLDRQASATIVIEFRDDRMQSALLKYLSAHPRLVAVVGLFIFAIVAMSQFSWWRTPAPATAAAPATIEPGSVRVSAEQMHQLERITVGTCTFQQQRTAIGQIAFNEDASTNVFTPFSGRVTRLMA